MEGKTEEWFEKNKWMIRKKKRLYKQEPQAMIEWDPSRFTFDWEGKPTTVAEYFREYYGIDLQYHNVSLRVAVVTPVNWLCSSSSLSFVFVFVADAVRLS